MRAVLFAVLVFLVSSCALLPKSGRDWRPLEIENLDSGFAFKGHITGRYCVEEDHVLVEIDRWQIRFSCHDQESRLLDEISFALAVDYRTDRYRWNAVAYGNSSRVDRVIARSQDIVLEDLEFKIPLDGVENLNETWLVAVYTDTMDDVRGTCYAHHSDYLLSGEETRFHQEYGS